MAKFLSHKIYFILLLFIGILFSSCNPKVVKSKAKLVDPNAVGTTASSISLVSPTSTPNFISAPTLLLSGVVSGETVNLYGDAACSAVIRSGVATGSSITLVTPILSVGLHSFYTNSTSAHGKGTCSSLLLNYYYLGPAPTQATALVLFSPTSSPDYDSTPTFSLSGVVSGETISLYTDIFCSSSVGSAVATSSNVQVTTSALAPGSYTFYTTSTNSSGTSACSIISASYQYLGVAPVTATTMALAAPTISPNYVSTPTITVSGGVTNGDTVKIYTDSSCMTLVGSKTSTGASVTITTSTLAVGATSFWTRSTNIIGSSACSAASLLTYNYLGAAPTVQVSWNANRETAVNRTGGGYKVYYSTTSNFNISGASFKNVPYVSGALSPVTTTIDNLTAGVTYFKVVAYSALNSVGVTTGSTSLPSSQFTVSLP